jgi:transcriptional regulator with XRE-family HTH domain
MDAASTIRSARTQAGLSLRELARRAGTSHATIAAYESGVKCPTVQTVTRIVEAAGFALDADLQKRIRGEAGDRGDELLAVLELAEQFPARHAATLDYPRFR